jgi:malate synthase
LADGRKATFEMFRELTGAELKKIERTVGEEAFTNGKYELAARLFGEIIQNDVLEEFLTLRAYEHLD